MVSLSTVLTTALILGPSLVFGQVQDGLLPSRTVLEEPKREITPELRGDIAMARKMYREAIDYYKTGAEKNAILANKTGIAYHQLLDLKNAKKYYQKAIKLNRRYAEALNNLGTVYYAEKSYKRAITQYKKSLKVAPNVASVLGNLGSAYFARKKYDEAMTYYQQALAINPDIFEQRGGQGSLVQERTIEDRARYDYYMAKTYAKLGSTDRALQYVRRALEEGFKDRDKFLQEPEFTQMQKDPEFQRLLATEQNVL